MGGKSKSKSTVTTTSENASLNESDDSILIQSDGDVDILDAGAISNAFQFGESSLTNQSDNFSELLDFGETVFSKSIDTAAAATTSDNIKNSSQNVQLIETALKLGALVGAIWIFSNVARGK